MKTDGIKYIPPVTKQPANKRTEHDPVDLRRQNLQNSGKNTVFRHVL